MIVQSGFASFYLVKFLQQEMQYVGIKKVSFVTSKLKLRKLLWTILNI